MTLFRRHILTSVALALPAAYLVFIAVNGLAAQDRITALERVAEAHATSIMRDACEQDPRWFLAGPRLPRPPLADRQLPDADVNLPRPSAEQLPFEMFAYDEQFSPSSTAGPRFPDEFKRAFRQSSTLRKISGDYASNTGAGEQTAIATGWTPGRCAMLLFRQQPAPHHARDQWLLLAGLFGLFLVMGVAVTAPTSARVRTLSLAARRSAKRDYADIVTVSGADEVGSFGALFNDMAADLRRKNADALEREEALRRYVDNTNVEVGAPLGELERRLGRVMTARPDSDVAAAVKEAHRLSMQVRNQAAAIRLRTITEDSPRESVKLSDVVATLAADRAALLQAGQVTIDLSKAAAPATVKADPALMELAIANVLDNAIIYNRAGGTVRVELHAYDHGQRISVLIADSGPGVSDEEFEGLTANKRFRGDESRTRRPGGRGLGLAIAREVADRFGLKLDLRQPSSGGLEAEFSTR